MRPLLLRTVFQILFGFPNRTVKTDMSALKSVFGFHFTGSCTFVGLWKIYSCLFIPNCTRNHVITYTYINIWDQKVQNSVFYEAFLPITCPGPRTRLNHLYSPSEERLERLRRRQVTPALGLIQVISGVGEGLPWKYSTEYDSNYAWFLPILGLGKKKIR